MEMTEWYPHRRPDGEVLGWIVPDGDGFRAIDLLGRRVGPPSLDWIQAEEVLEDRGIGYLADRYTLRLPDGTERAVRITEVGTDGITVIADEFGMASAVGGTHERFVLPFPAPDALRPRS
jgi:hypothetical protein